MFTIPALKRIRLFDCFLDFQFNSFLVFAEVLLKKKTLQLHKYALHTISRGPTLTLLSTLLLSDNIQTNIIVENIWMRDLIEDGNCGRMMWVTKGKFDFQVEDSSLIHSSFRTFEVGMPHKDIIFKWSSNNSNSGYYFPLNLLQIFD